jgi:hypothetical protein
MCFKPLTYVQVKVGKVGRNLKKTQEHRIQAARPTPLKEPRKEEANSPVSDMVPPYHGGPVGISDFFPRETSKALLRLRKFPPFHSRCSRGRGCLVLSAFRLPRIIESVALRLEEVAVLLMKGVLPLSGSVLQPGWSKRLAGSEADETLSRSGRERWVLVVFLQGGIWPGGLCCCRVNHRAKRAFVSGMMVYVRKLLIYV